MEGINRFFSQIWCILHLVHNSQRSPLFLLKDDNKQNDGEETWGDNDDNINADPTWGNENISFDSQTDQHWSNTHDPGNNDNDDNEGSNDS